MTHAWVLVPLVMVGCAWEINLGSDTIFKTQHKRGIDMQFNGYSSLRVTYTILITNKMGKGQHLLLTL